MHHPTTPTARARPPRPRRWVASRLAGTLAVALLVTLPGATGFAREATVATKDGRRLTGELKFQNDKTVLLVIAGIETPIPRDQVAELTLLPTPEEVYQEQRPKLERDDLQGRLDLAQRMYQLKALELARSELGDLARDFPGESRVLQMITVIDAEIALQKERAGQITSPRERHGNPPTPRERGGKAEAGELLSPEQINLIRVYQVDLDASPRGVRIDPTALTDFFDRYREQMPEEFRGGGGQRAFRRLGPAEQLAVFFRLQARDLYEKVTISQDPPALQAFRSQINPNYVARYFAEQFGNGQVEGLKLYTSRPDSTEEAYTNFYALLQFRTPAGLPLIDFTKPEESLLVQWGLPRDQTKYPAPEVPGWQPAFRSLDDPRARQIIDWIATVYEVKDYGFVYPPAAESPPTPAPAPTPPAGP